MANNIIPIQSNNNPTFHFVFNVINRHFDSTRTRNLMKFVFDLVSFNIHGVNLKIDKHKQCLVLQEYKINDDFYSHNSCTTNITVY